MTSIKNFKVSVFIWRNLIRQNPSFTKGSNWLYLIYGKEKLASLDYFENRELLKVNQLKKLDTNQKKEILTRVNKLIEKAKQISLNNAKKEFYPYDVLHQSLVRIKKTHVKFSKEVKELLIIRDEINLLFEHYEEDQRASKDFVYLMEDYLKCLHKIDAFKLYKVNLKIERGMKD